MDTRLLVRNVSKSFAGLKAVQNISLDAAAGEITSLIGPNGAGKTTLFNCITGLVRPDRSDSRLERAGRPDVPLGGLDAEDMPRVGIARTFQQARLFDSLCVLDNVVLGGLHRQGLGWLAALADRLGANGRRHRLLRIEAERLLARVGMEHQGHELAGDLDHGNRRRLEIARALASEPVVLLLDEPAAGMNRTETDQLMELLRRLRDEGMAVLLIEHDMQLVMRVSDRIHVMDHGELLTSGAPGEIAADPRVIEAYLGSAATGHAAG